MIILTPTPLYVCCAAAPSRHGPGRFQSRLRYPLAETNRPDDVGFRCVMATNP